MVYQCRGDKFRTAFAEIGELRSIIPNEVPVMALTATCTQSVFEAVTNSLLLKSLLSLHYFLNENYYLFNQLMYLHMSIA